MKRLIIALGLLASGCGFTSTGTNEAAVFSYFGKVEDRCYPSGFYMYNPFTTSVYHVDLKMQALTIEKAETVTHDLQKVLTDLVVNFVVNAQNCHKLISGVGEDFKQRIIVPQTFDALKAATAKFAVEKVVQERAKIKDMIVTDLRTRLAPYEIDVRDVPLTNFAFEGEYAHAVERKQIEEQNVQREEFIRLQREKQGEQFKALAKGQAEANILLQNSLKASPEVLQMKALEKWNGVLPQYTGGPVPFINLTPAK